MSVDSKVFVTIGDNDIIAIANAVVEAINKWLHAKLDIEVEKSGANSRFHFLNSKGEFESERWSMCCHATTYYFDCFSIYFGCGDGRGGDATRRRLFMSWNGCDYNEVAEGKKLIFSIGCWGSNEEIIDIVAKSLVYYGDTYYIYNDCQDDWQKQIGESND